MEDRLALLEAEREVLRTLHTYCRAIDSGDEQAWIDCFLADATLQWPTVAFPAPFVGHERIREAFRGHTHAPDVYHKHIVVNAEIEIDGDTAHVQSSFVRFDNSDDGPYVYVFGRYVDVLCRSADGRWRFKSRHCPLEGSRWTAYGEAGANGQ